MQSDMLTIECVKCKKTYVYKSLFGIESKCPYCNFVLKPYKYKKIRQLRFIVFLPIIIIYFSFIAFLTRYLELRYAYVFTLIVFFPLLTYIDKRVVKYCLYKYYIE